MWFGLLNIKKESTQNIYLTIAQLLFNIHNFYPFRFCICKITRNDDIFASNETEIHFYFIVYLFYCCLYLDSLKSLIDIFMVSNSLKWPTCMFKSFYSCRKYYFLPAKGSLIKRQVSYVSNFMPNH